LASHPLLLLLLLMLLLLLLCSLWLFPIRTYSTHSAATNETLEDIYFTSNVQNHSYTQPKQSQTKKNPLCASLPELDLLELALHLAPPQPLSLICPFAHHLIPSSSALHPFVVCQHLVQPNSSIQGRDHHWLNQSQPISTAHSPLSSWAHDLNSTSSQPSPQLPDAQSRKISTIFCLSRIATILNKATRNQQVSKSRHFMLFAHSSLSSCLKLRVILFALISALLVLVLPARFSYVFWRRVRHRVQ